MKIRAKCVKIICNVSAKYYIAHWPKWFVDMADAMRGRVYLRMNNVNVCICQ